MIEAQLNQISSLLATAVSALSSPWVVADVIIGVFSATATAWAAVFAYKSAKSSERAVQASFMPIVRPYIHDTGMGKSALKIVLKNESSHVALEILVSVLDGARTEKVAALSAEKEYTVDFSDTDIWLKINQDKKLIIEYTTVLGDRIRLEGLFQVNTNLSRVENVETQSIKYLTRSK